MDRTRFYVDISPSVREIQRLLDTNAVEKAAADFLRDIILYSTEEDGAPEHLVFAVKRLVDNHVIGFAVSVPVKKGSLKGPDLTYDPQSYAATELSLVAELHLLEPRDDDAEAAEDIAEFILCGLEGFEILIDHLRITKRKLADLFIVKNNEGIVAAETISANEIGDGKVYYMPGRWLYEAVKTALSRHERIIH